MNVNEFCEKHRINMEGREELQAMLAARTAAAQAQADPALHKQPPQPGEPPADVNDGSPPNA